MTLLIIASWTFKEIFATLLRRYYFGSFHSCHETTRSFKGTSEEHVKQKKDGLRLQHRERSAESEFKGCVFDAF